VVSEIAGGVTAAVALGANETELTNRMSANNNNGITHTVTIASSWHSYANSTLLLGSFGSYFCNILDHQCKIM